MTGLTRKVGEGEMKIIDDKRQIKALVYPDGARYCVGSSDVTVIEPYEESGEMAYVTWFAVWQEEHLICRANSKFIAQVEY